MRAIQISEFGGPEVLESVDLEIPEPGEGERLIHVARAGVNFADTHERTNSYIAKAQLPLVPGKEVAGTAQDSGERVLALCGTGGYAEYAIAPAALTWPIPEGVDDATALALLVQGVTAVDILRFSGRLAPGESVVVHAAAGGVGSLAVQLAKSFGAGRVIATASSDEKRALALDLGADVAIDPSPEQLKERLIEANDGERVDIVLEMAGGEVFKQSLSALAPFGRLVAYGNASQQRTEVSAGALMSRSRAVIGFWLMHCLERPELFNEPLELLFEHVRAGSLRVPVGSTYPLSQAAQAQIDLQQRRTTGKVVLDPSG